VGLLRGEELNNLPLAQKPGIERLLGFGMQIEVLDRPTYRSVCEHGPTTTIPQIWNNLDRPYFIPEGASGPLALLGLITEAKTWVGDLNPKAQLVVPVGTGATMAGITIARYEVAQSMGWPTLPPPTLGFAPFRDQAYCTSLVLDQISNYLIEKGIADPMALASELAKVIAVPNLGRYGRPSSAVLASVANHKSSTGQQLNPIYSGFCLAALEASFERAELDPSAQFVLVDTGGAA
jgi:1-aminocyclopropane-1-carboxylate deaminase/D-cysteine desulfhydrase-like pyridoxal-dependent ACC family enzyme